MALVNLFDTGNCTVVILAGHSGDTPAQVYSQVLAKGDSDGPISDGLGNSLSIDVSAGGQVTLSVDEYGSGLEYEVRVVPATTVASLSVQSASMACNTSAASGKVTAYPADSGQALVTSGGACTPDPAIRPASVSNLYVAMNTIGSGE